MLLREMAVRKKKNNRIDATEQLQIILPEMSVAGWLRGRCSLTLCTCCFSFLFDSCFLLPSLCCCYCSGNLGGDYTVFENHISGFAFQLICSKTIQNAFEKVDGVVQVSPDFAFALPATAFSVSHPITNRFQYVSVILLTLLM